jgi:hypothetical protein
MAMLMKGETWADACKLVRGAPRFQYPIYVEVKADEIRCRVFREDGQIKFESYAQKPLHNLEGFADQFSKLFTMHGLDELDIGVLVNGNFNDSYRWTRSSKGWPKEKLDKKTGLMVHALIDLDVAFILFDIPGATQPYYKRAEVLDQISYNGSEHCGLRMTRPARHVCHSEAEVLARYVEFREAGQEGAMGKTFDHLYERRRTFGWMKIKPKETFDGRITGFNEAVSEDGQPLARVGSINVECEDGSVASPSGIPHALGRELWANQQKYLGQWIEFECMERDRRGGYRHPIFHRFREDKA